MPNKEIKDAKSPMGKNLFNPVEANAFFLCLLITENVAFFIFREFRKRAFSWSGFTFVVKALGRHLW